MKEALICKSIRIGNRLTILDLSLVRKDTEDLEAEGRGYGEGAGLP
jgi:hypothetical protein